MKILRNQKIKSCLAALTVLLFVLADILGMYSQVHAQNSDAAKVNGISVSTGHGGEVMTPGGNFKNTDVQKIRLSINFDKEIKLMDKNGNERVTDDILEEFNVKLDSTVLTDTEVKSVIYDFRTYGKYTEISLSEDEKTLYIDVYVGYTAGVGTVTVTGSGENTTILTSDNDQAVEWEDISVQTPVGVQLTTLDQVVADGNGTNASVTKQIGFSDTAIRGNIYFVLLKNGQPVKELAGYGPGAHFYFNGSSSAYLDTDAAAQMMQATGTGTLQGYFSLELSDLGYTLTVDEADPTRFMVTTLGSAEGDVLDVLVVEYPRQSNEGIDNGVLSGKIDDAKVFKKSSYTIESYAALASALAVAQSVYKNVSTTNPVYYLQSEVDAQTAALTAAIEGLVPSGGEQGEDPDDGEDTEPAKMTGYEVETLNQGDGTIPAESGGYNVITNDQIVRVTLNYDKDIYLSDTDGSGDPANDVLEEFKIYLGAAEENNLVTSEHKDYYGVDRYAEVSAGSDRKSLILDIHTGHISDGRLVIDSSETLTSVKTEGNDLGAECEDIDIYHTNGVSMETVSQTIADPDKGIDASVTVDVTAPTGALIRSYANFLLLEDGELGPKGGFQGLEILNWYTSSSNIDIRPSFNFPSYNYADFHGLSYETFYLSQLDYLSMDSESYAEQIENYLKTYLDDFNEQKGENKYEVEYEIIRTGTQITITKKDAVEGEIIDFLMAGNQREAPRGTTGSITDNAKDKSDLQNLISQAGKLKEASYTEESYEVFSEALAFARVVNGSKYYLQSEVDAQLTKLTGAIGQLVLSGEAPEEPEEPGGSAKVTGISSVYSEHGGEVSYPTYKGNTDNFDEQIFYVTVNFDKEITLVDKDGDGNPSDDVVDELDIILNGTMHITSTPTGMLSYEYTTEYEGAEPYKKYATVSLGEDGKSLEFMIYIGYAPFSGKIQINAPEEHALTTILTTDTLDSVDWSDIDFYMSTGARLETVEQVVATESKSASVTKKVSGFPEATRGMVHLIFLKNGVPVEELNPYGGNIVGHNHNYLSMTNGTFSMLIAGTGGVDVDDGGFGAGSSGYFGNAFDKDYISAAYGDTFTITAKDSEPGDVLDILVVGYPRDTRIGYTEGNAQDKSGLEEAIQKAEAIDSSLYTAKTYAALQAEIAKAEIVYDSEYYLQEEVEAQIENLEGVIFALRTVEEGDLPEEEQPGGNDSEGEAKGIFLTDIATGIQITAVRGVLPEGVQCIIEQLTSGVLYDSIKEQLKGISDKFLIFDISLWKDGISVQPEGKVEIKIPVPEGYDVSKIKLYHIHGDTKEEVEFTVNDGYIIFFADSFSPYVIVEAASVQQAVTSAVVQTGDNARTALWICTGASCVIVLWMMRIRKRVKVF